MSSVAASPAAWQPPVISVQRSSTDGAVSNASPSSNTSPTSSKHHQSKPGTPPPDTTWGSNFWVTLADPQTGAEFFACPATGECSWEPPVGNFVLPANDHGQWWELSDESRNGLSYYYHTVTGETRWEKPTDSFVIPLKVIQTTTLGRRLSVTAMSKRNSQIGNPPEDSTTESPSTSRTKSKREEKQREPPIAENVSSTRDSPTSQAHGNGTNSTNSPTSASRSDKQKGKQSPTAPPSPTRRQSGPPYRSAMSHQQSLDAAAEMLVKSSTEGFPGGLHNLSKGVEQSRSAPNFRQAIQQEDVNATFTPNFNPEFNVSVNGTGTGTGTGGSPTKDVSAAKLTVMTSSLRKEQGSKSAAPSPLKPRANGSSVPERLRPRRNTTTTVGQIGKPVVGQDFRQSPLVNAGGGPILVNDDSQLRTKRLSTGDHRTLPRNLAQEIEQFQVADFAKRYFSTHRTGLLFRRRVPVEQLMSWQKAPLNSPLLVLNRSQHKDAVKIFKIIQRIMGDRASDRQGGLRMHSESGYTSGKDSGRESETSYSRSIGTSVMEEERWLLGEGLLHGELRDEIYCQVVKQLSGNPSQESIFRGWQLMCVLLVTFPPSKNFEEYLRAFMREKTSQTEGRIDVMAKYCLAKLRVVARRGPRGKAPSVQEIEIAQDAAFNPSTFGESLRAIVQLQQQTYPNAKIPIILPFLADGILALGGMKSEGIFRVPGENDVVSELRLRIDRGFYNLEGIDDPHVPASLLKLWLRELQDPLIPEELYNQCIVCSEEPEKVVQMVSALPTINRRVLLFVISFLQNFLDERVTITTKMTAVNLAVVFAPNLLRCPSDSMAVVFTNAKYEQTFVLNLLKHCNCSKMDPDFVPVHGMGPQ